MTTAAAAAASIGVIAWFIQPHHFWTKVWVFAAMVGAIALSILASYLYKLFVYAKQTMVAYEALPQQIQGVRTSTWVAVQTNLLLSDYPIDILRLKLDEAFILFLIDVGSYLGAQTGMEFEIVAVPDMEVYGVIRVFQVEEEKSWCVLEEGEGRSDFYDQMKQRLRAGDVAPPAGYQVRPFMAAAFQYVVNSVRAQPLTTTQLTTTDPGSPVFTIPPPAPWDEGSEAEDLDPDVVSQGEGDDGG